MALAENGDHHFFDRSCLAGDHAPQFSAGVSNQLVGCVQTFWGFSV